MFAVDVVDDSIPVAREGGSSHRLSNSRTIYFHERRVGSKFQPVVNFS